MKISTDKLKNLSKEDQLIVRDIERGHLDPDNYCYCERCNAIHTWMLFKGKRVMIGKCGAFAKPV